MKTFPQNEIVKDLHRLVFLMDKIADHLLQKNLHLTFSQFRILVSVLKHDKPTQADIAKLLDISPAAISRQIELLSSKRLILSSRSSKNHREHPLQLSPLGKAQISKAIDIMGGSFQSIYEVLGDKEQKATAGSISKLIAHIHDKGIEYFCKTSPTKTIK